MYFKSKANSASRSSRFHERSTAALLAGAVGAVSVFGTATAVKADDPAVWRDASRQELRKNWDTLEGKPALSIKPLSGWIHADSGTNWEALRGNVVLIDYWATWCGPCKAAIPHLVDLYEEEHEKGLEIIGIHSPNGVEKMADFVKENKLPYTFAEDRTGAIGNALGIRFIPSYFIVDKRGVMRVAGINRAKIDEVVEALLKEPYTPPNQNEKRAQKPADKKDYPADPKATDWPPILKKTLYASDFRGKQAPTLFVDEWLTDQPKQEGKVLMVDFWATWCGPCRKLIPEVNEYQKKFGNDLVVIGLSGEKADVVKAFAEKTKMDYALGVDPKGRTASKLGIKGIPHVMIVSTDGIVRWQGFPGSDKDPLTAEIIKQIIERDPGVAERRAAERKAAAEGKSASSTKDNG